MMKKVPAGIKWWKCDDFSWSVGVDGMVKVFDGAEGCSYAMTSEQILNAMVEIILEEDVENNFGESTLTVDTAQRLARQIIAKSTKIGMCCFVKNYCEV
jgi:hypothetical protein